MIMYINLRFTYLLTYFTMFRLRAVDNCAGQRDHVDGLDRRPRASSDGNGAALADLSDTQRN